MNTQDGRKVPTRLTVPQRHFLKMIKQYGIGEACHIAEWDVMKIEDERERSPVFNKRYLEAIGLSERQEEFLNMYIIKAGNVAGTCKAIGVVRGTYYHWIRSNEVFRELVDDHTEQLIDFAEGQLMKNIQEGRDSAIFYFLNAKGRNRGYGLQEKDKPAITVTANTTVSTPLTKNMTDEEVDQRIKELEDKNNTTSEQGTD